MELLSVSQLKHRSNGIVCLQFYRKSYAIIYWHDW